MVKKVTKTYSPQSPASHSKYGLGFDNTPVHYDAHIVVSDGSSKETCDNARENCRGPCWSKSYDDARNCHESCQSDYLDCLKHVS